MVLTLHPPGKKRLDKPALNSKPTFNKVNHCDKFNKDPKLKALLSAFAAFTSDYTTEDS
jgi:hypothetical protein